MNMDDKNVGGMDMDHMNHMNMGDMMHMSGTDHPAGHGMLLFGEEAAYLSHLPMFSSPHNYQAIFEVTLSRNGTDLMTVIRDDRKAHPQFKMYSFVPTQNFVLTDLVTFILDEHRHPRGPVLNSFPGEIYRGHFETWHEHEKPESDPAKPIPGLENVVARVTNVVLFRQLDAYAQAPPLLLPLEYFLFGKARELFLAHVITHSPDFDQVLGIQADSHQFTDDQLRRGMLVTFPERANSQDKKINEQDQVIGQVLVPGQGGPQPVEVQFKAGTEFYFETDDLESVPMHILQPKER